LSIHFGRATNFTGFDWDNANLGQCRKHFAAGNRGVVERHVAPDVTHSAQQPRFLAIGRNGAGRPPFVVFRLRESDGLTPLRPIGARYMHNKEIDVDEDKGATL